MARLTRPCPKVRIGIGLCIAAMLTADTSRAEGLEQAWAAALEANQGFKAAQSGTSAAVRGAAAARAERVPTVTTVNAYTWLNNTPSFKATLPLPGSATPISLTLPFLNREFFVSSTLANIPLYTGGRLLSGIEAADAQAFATRAQESSAVQDLKLEVTRAYLDVLRIEKLLILARSNVTSLQAHERDVRNLFKEGVAKRTDLLASQVSLARARQRVIQASNELEVAHATYNRLLCRPLTAPTTLEEMRLRIEPESAPGPGPAPGADTGSGHQPGPVPERDSTPSPNPRPSRPADGDVKRTAARQEAGPRPEAMPLPQPTPSTAARVPVGPRLEGPRPDGSKEADIERLTATALASRSELASLAGEARAYAAQARVAESAKRPQVGIVGGFTHISDTHLTSQDYWSGTLAATWLLFDGARANRRAESLRFKEGQSLRRRNDTASQIGLAVRSAWLSLQSSRAALLVARSATGQADENLRETRERYREQVVTNTEVLDAETLRLQTYTDYYNSFYAVLQDEFRLRRAVGVL